MNTLSTNIESEAHCLSSLKSASDVYAANSSGLTAKHFTERKHQLVFAAKNRAAIETGEVDLQAVWTQLLSLGGNSPLTMGELIDIDSLEPTSLNRNRYVNLVIGCARKNTLINELTEALQEAKADAEDWHDVWGRVSPHIQAAQETVATNQVRTVPEMCATVRKEIEEPSTAKLLSTSFASWDQNAGPFNAWEMIALGGRPGTGKTTLALHVAGAAAARGKNVAFFSLEMTGEELVTRLALNYAGRDAVGDHPRARAEFFTALNAVSKNKALHIFDNRQRYTIDAIEARCRLLAAGQGGLDFVVIDYLQLIEPTDLRAPREQQVAQISRRIKQMAGTIGAPILVLTQLNRDSEKEERRPRLSDLRESGAIEQDSDRVWLLWNQPDNNAPKQTDEDESIDVSLIQAKCRGGRSNIFTKLRFDRPCYRFTPIVNR